MYYPVCIYFYIYIHSWLQLRRNSFGGDTKGAFGLGFAFSRYRRCNHLTPETTTCYKGIKTRGHVDHIVVHILNMCVCNMSCHAIWWNVMQCNVVQYVINVMQCLLLQCMAYLYIYIYLWYRHTYLYLYICERISNWPCTHAIQFWIPSARKIWRKVYRTPKGLGAGPLYTHQGFHGFACKDTSPCFCTGRRLTDFRAQNVAGDNGFTSIIEIWNGMKWMYSAYSV